MLLLKLALRNVLRNRRRSLLTIISMGGGYFLLSAMAAMTEGSYSNMIDLFTGDHTGHVQIHQQDYLTRPNLYKTIKSPNQILRKLKKHKDVVSVSPRIYGPSLAYGNQKSSPTNVIGIDSEQESKTTALKEKLKFGEYLIGGQTSHGYFPAMIGHTLAKNLKLNVGDQLVLISQGMDGSIANDVFNVTGIVGTDDSNERLNVYVSLEAMSSFLSFSNQVHEIVIKLTHQRLAKNFAATMQSMEENTQNIYSPWQVVEAGFYNGMQADKKGNYVSMGILIFIVAIGVLNAVLMSTLERTHEFGVLKAIGTRPAGIARLILLESSLLAIASCILGAMFALPLNYWMMTEGIAMPTPVEMGGIKFDTMLGEINAFSVGMPALVVIFSTLMVSVVPAIHASKISPVEAMRH